MQHDWLTDSLAPAMANRNKEKEDFTTMDAVPRVRLHNYIQHMSKGYMVTDAQEQVMKAGVKSELAYQMVKASKELSRDLEYAIVNNASAIAGNSVTGGQFGGVKFFTGGDAITFVVDTSTDIVTFTDHKLQTGAQVIFYINAGGTLPTSAPQVVANKPYYVRIIDENTFKVFATKENAQANTSPIDFSVVGNCKITRSNIISLNADLQEENFNDIMQICWMQGASIEDAVMSGRRKRQVSGFTAGTTRTKDMSNTKLSNVVEVIESDFGMIQLHAHRQYTDDRVDFFEYQNWKLAFLQPFKVEDVPRKGTYKEKIITGMLTLENRSPISNGAIINIT